MSGISITGSKAPPKTSPWRQFHLLANPFPPSGVATDVDYDQHQPLAISGSIGVGKTHVLRKMERACSEFRDGEKLGARLMVSSQTLVGTGMKTLLLSNLLLEALNQPLPSGNLQVNSTEMPLLGMAVERMLLDKNTRVLEDLPATSPIRKPLTKIAAAKTGDDATRMTNWLASWLARRNLSRDQLEHLGLSGKLEGEGQAVRAFAHVCRFAKGVMGFRVWMLFLDQMEDLWRRDVTTALRRTRFLTDLRTLIDEALEGSPVAVTLAWNTEVLIAGSRVEEDVSDRLQRDYLALFSRVSKVVSISTLPQGHLLPFAAAYVEHANAIFKADKVASRGVDHPESTRFIALLDQNFDAIQTRIKPWGRRKNDRSVVARAWLDALREWADDLIPPAN
jgi:hypothetical protein